MKYEYGEWVDWLIMWQLKRWQ